MHGRSYCVHGRGVAVGNTLATPGTIVVIVVVSIKCKDTADFHALPLMTFPVRSQSLQSRSTSCVGDPTLMLFQVARLLASRPF